MFADTAAAIDSYKHLTRHIVPGPQDFFYLIPLVLLPISLCIPRSVLSRWQNTAIFLPVITVCTFRAWQAMEGVDVISVNTLLWAFFLIALEDPWKHFRLVRSGPRPYAEADTSKAADQSVREQTYPSSLSARLPWVGKLLIAIRFDYWKIGNASHDAKQPPKAGFASARHFLLHSAGSLVRAFVILDLTRAYIEYDPYFSDSSVSLASPLPFDSLQALPPQSVRSMVAGAQAYALIGEMFYLPAALPVLLSMVGILPEHLSPHTWPPYFGSINSILDHGVRGLWGTFWHQSMRWTTTGPGYAIANAAGLRHGGLLRYAVLSMSAFGLSGIVHSGLVPPEPRYMRENVTQVRLSMAGFFWSQWIAVTLEALVGKLVTSQTGAWKQGRRKLLRRIFNAAWVICWFSLSLPLLMDAARQLGYWLPWPLPISLWKWYNGQGLSTWF